MSEYSSAGEILVGGPSRGSGLGVRRTAVGGDIAGGGVGGLAELGGNDGEG